MPRQNRLQEYKSMKGPDGASRDPANLKYWSDRAEQNSAVAPRAKGGEMKLPDTDRGGGVAWKASHEGNMRAAGKRDKNDIGSTFMPNVRRPGT